MNRRALLATTAGGLCATLAGCASALTDRQTTPERPWPDQSTPESPNGDHDLYVENHTQTTERAWLRVTGNDGETLIDGRYELPDGRGLEFDDIAAWESTYTVELAIDGEQTVSLEWRTESCDANDETDDDSGSRNASVRVKNSDTQADHSVSIRVDEFDALYGPGVPVGPAETFRLSE